MKPIIPYCPDFPTTRKNSGRSSRLVLHYIIDGKTVCEAGHRLTANTRFIEIPLPVIHQMARGSMK